MPVPIVSQGIFDGVDTIPFAWQAIKIAPWLIVLYYLRVYFAGARNTSERNMHSKVVMITGGTSGVGASVARNLAQRGAQLVLLTQHSLDDPFLQDYIFDLRAETNNQLITAVHCDLRSLHSIRQFATKWVDNAPPRRLDMIILCANVMTPQGSPAQVSQDGVELNYAVNYLANFHLLSILAPAIKIQPPDRDVRILFATCSSYMGGRVLEQVPRPATDGHNPRSTTDKTKTKTKTKKAAWKGAGEKIIPSSASYACSKLSVMTFAAAFQTYLSAHERPDKQPNNTHVFIVDPGWCRTPGMRRFLSRGSLWGLSLYLVMWPFWWFVLKSSEGGAQSFLFAAMEANFERVGNSAVFLKEVIEAKLYKDEVRDEAVQKKLWETSEKAIELLEKEGAVARALAKKEEEEEENGGENVKPGKKINGHGAEDEKKEAKEKQPGSRKLRKAAKS